MRILLLVDCYLPSTKSSAKLMHDLATELCNRGHDVVVAAPDAELSTATEITTSGRLTVLRIRTRRIKGASRIMRAANEMLLSPLFWVAGRRFFREHPCQLIVYYSPTIFFGGLVLWLKRAWGCRSYLILRDIFPQWAVDARVLRRRSLAFEVFRRAELLQYAAADTIGVQSHANLSYFSERGWSDRYELEVLHNWTRLAEDVPVTDYRRALGLEGKTVFFYGGNIGIAQDMDNIVRLAASMRSRTDVRFLLVGEGSEVERLDRLIAELGLTNITIHPAVAQSEYLGMLAEFDVGLISLDRALKTQNFPGKMLGYMYFGIPILASINHGNDLGEILANAEAGLVTVNGDDAGLLRNANKLADDASLRHSVGEAGRRLLELRFSVEGAADQLLALFR